MRRAHLVSFTAVALAVVTLDVGKFSNRRSADEALAIATPALEATFPESFPQCRPYHAKFVDGVWHVRGTLPDRMFGGTPGARVRDADGQILQIFHGQ